MIDLWCTFLDALPEAAVFQYAALLDEAERRHEERFYFARDRRRYRVTRALVRTVLSRYAGIEPQQWVFTANAYGKPAIGNEGPEARRIAFNVTHTDGLIIVAVGRELALGVDAENIRTRPAPLDVASAFFAPEEVAALSRLSNDRRPQRFYEYWTLKESYIKACGRGLSMPLDRFAFRMHGHRDIALAIDRDLDDSPARWRFWQFWASPDHLAAVCAERRGPESPALTLRQIVPLVSESPLEYAPLRASDGFAMWWSPERRARGHD